MSNELHSRGPSTGFLVAVAILVPIWFAASATIASSGAFLAGPAEPPLALLAAIAVPPILFLLLFNLVEPFRREILSIDPVWLTAVQGLRMIGAGFLFLYTFGHLPGLFAHPAGWGDMLVAALASFIAARLARDPGFLRSRALWRFHALGMLDFAGAVGTGVLAGGTFPSLVEGGISTSPLVELPLALIPGFAVPLWICLHLAAFAQIRAARRREGRSAGPAVMARAG
jgi:hypothetical protein